MEKRSFHKTQTKMCAQWQIRRDPVPSMVNLAMKQPQLSKLLAKYSYN